MPRLTVLLAVLWATSLIAQNIHPTPPPEVTAVQLREEIHLDGKLDEAVWHTAPIATGFRQNQPHEGQPATQRTEVRFAFDDAAIYVGARMFDDHGAAGVRTPPGRRGGSPHPDYVEVIFDPHHGPTRPLFFPLKPTRVRGAVNRPGTGA